METNNKLREALEALVEVIDKCDSGSPLWWHSGAKGVKPLKDAHAALAEPVKNCEVGTVEQQAKRFEEYCESEVCKRNRCKSQAKALCIERCALEWAQMPYKEGDDK